jgi:hypothetical protein
LLYVLVHSPKDTSAYALMFQALGNIHNFKINCGGLLYFLLLIYFKVNILFHIYLK